MQMASNQKSTQSSADSGAQVSVALAAPDIELGGADSEAQVSEKLAAFVAGASYPFDIAISNKAGLPLVFPFLHGEIIKAGDTGSARINEPSQIAELFFSGHSFGMLHDTEVMISVSMVPAFTA